MILGDSWGRRVSHQIQTCVSISTSTQISGLLPNGLPNDCVGDRRTNDVSPDLRRASQSEPWFFRGGWGRHQLRDDFTVLGDGNCLVFPANVRHEAEALCFEFGCANSHLTS
jgi:mannose-6-phosphate isomerase-like protein (cupin superfamily)